MAVAGLCPGVPGNTLHVVNTAQTHGADDGEFDQSGQMGDGAARTGSPGLQTNKETGPFGHLGNLESWDNKAIHHVCCPHPCPALVSTPGLLLLGLS